MTAGNGPESGHRPPESQPAASPIETFRTIIGRAQETATLDTTENNSGDPHEGEVIIPPGKRGEVARIWRDITETRNASLQAINAHREDLNNLIPDTTPNKDEIIDVMIERLLEGVEAQTDAAIAGLEFGQRAILESQADRTEWWTREAVKDMMAMEILRVIRGNESAEQMMGSLRQFGMVIGDMTLFNFAMKTIMSTGLDARIEDLAYGSTLVSAVTARRLDDAPYGTYRDQLKGDVNGDLLDNDPGRMYFPPGSQAEQQLLAQETQTDVMRYNGGGGDEVIVVVRGTSDQMQQGLDLWMHIVTSTAISPNTILDPQLTGVPIEFDTQDTEKHRREAITKDFIALPNDLVVSPYEVYGLTDVSVEEVARLEAFLKELRLYIRSSAFSNNTGFESIEGYDNFSARLFTYDMLDPYIVPTMDCALTNYDGHIDNLEDTLYGVFFGKNTHGKEYLDVNGHTIEPIQDAEGNINEARMNRYTQKLKKDVQMLLPPDQQQDPVKVRALMEELLAKYIADEHLTALLMNVNNIGKKKKKVDQLIVAFKGEDHKTIMNVAAGANRMVNELHPPEKIEVSRQLLDYYEDLFDQLPDESTPDIPADLPPQHSLDHLRRFKRRWNERKKNIIVPDRRKEQRVEPSQGLTDPHIV